MFFFDDNSCKNHQKFDKEIKSLKNSIEFYKKGIKENEKMINTLQDSKKIEKFARETYQMKKKDETLFIIEFDTLK